MYWARCGSPAGSAAIVLVSEITIQPLPRDQCVVVRRVRGQQPLVVVGPAGGVRQVLRVARHTEDLDVALDEQRVEPGRVAETGTAGDPVVRGELDRREVGAGRSRVCWCTGTRGR